MAATLIKNARIVNEGEIREGDVLIRDRRIQQIADTIPVPKNGQCRVIEAEGDLLLPGMIDDQVHFRDPGFPKKADLSSESKAAVAGGITSFMDMPNTQPNTLTQELLEEKYQKAAQKSVANYSFFMGVNKNNLEEVLKTDSETVCGVTDDGLYFDDDEGLLANHPEFLDQLFSKVPTLIALHCEDDSIIRRNEEKLRAQYGEEIPFRFHPAIRSEEACVNATRRVLDIARKHGTRFHLLHVSTAAEAQMLDGSLPPREKRITGEACVHHLWFNDGDYERLGARIKWNPAIKTEEDQRGLMDALLSNQLDIIATDHAPHAVGDKSGNYFQAMSGGPLVQHALPILLELRRQGRISFPQIAEKTAHHVAEIYRLQERGYIREGYYADLVLVKENAPWDVTRENLRYKCRWSPLTGTAFTDRITHTFVNGQLAYEEGQVHSEPGGMRLRFEKER